MKEQIASKQTLRRLPIYLHYLNHIKDASENISATGIAEVFGLNDVQVRKDLAAVSGSGKPKTGYNILSLISQIENYLHCGKDTKTVLIGVGHLGNALLSYDGFNDYGLNIVAAFDKNKSVTGIKINGKDVFLIDKLDDFCLENNISLAILTVPVTEAQTMCDRLVKNGIRAIWNFAPTILRVPDGVTVENENLASSLAVLSNGLHNNNE